MGSVATTTEPCTRAGKIDPTSTPWNFGGTYNGIVENVGPNGEDAYSFTFDNNVNDLKPGINVSGSSKWSWGVFVRAANTTFDTNLVIRDRDSNQPEDAKNITVTTDWDWYTLEGSSFQSPDDIRIGQQTPNYPKTFYILKAGFNRGPNFSYSTQSTEPQTIPDIVGGADLQNGSTASADTNDLKFQAPRGVVSDGDALTEEIDGPYEGTWVFRFRPRTRAGNTATNIFGNAKFKNEEYVGFHTYRGGGWVVNNTNLSTIGETYHGPIEDDGTPYTCAFTVDYQENRLTVIYSDGTAVTNYLSADEMPQKTPFRPLHRPDPGTVVTHLEHYPVLTPQEAEAVRQRLANNPSDLVPPTERWDFGQNHNLLTYSEEYDNNDWSKKRSTVSSTSVTAPDGESDSYKLSVDSKLHLPVLRQKAPEFVGFKTTSVFYAKANTLDWIVIRGDYNDGNNNFSQTFTWFDLSNGVIGSTSVTDSDNNHDALESSMQDVGNGWYRLSVTHEPTSGSYIDFAGIELAERDDRRIDGTYASQGDSVYVWGAQFVRGEEKMPPYVQTSGSIAFPQIVPALRDSSNDLTLGSTSSADTNDPDWIAPIGVRGDNIDDTLKAPRYHDKGNVTWIIGLNPKNNNNPLGRAEQHGWQFVGGDRFAIYDGNNVLDANGPSYWDNNLHVFVVRLDVHNKQADAWSGTSLQPEYSIDYSSIGDLLASGPVGLMGKKQGSLVTHAEVYTRALTNSEVQAARKRILDNPDSTPSL